jgi:hypothetical protein
LSLADLSHQPTEKTTTCSIRRMGKLFINHRLWFSTNT